MGPMFVMPHWVGPVLVAVAIMYLVRRRRRFGRFRRWGWDEDGAWHGRRSGSDRPWWRDPVPPERAADGDPVPRDGGPARAASEGQAAAASQAPSGAGAAGGPRLLPEQRLDELQRAYVEGRLTVEAYEQQLDSLYGGGGRKRRFDPPSEPE